MKAVIQRVKIASVAVNGETVGKCGEGLMVLFGAETGDTAEDAALLAKKTAALRIFCDENDKMNRSLLDADGAILAVSQFTLMGDCSHGRRPGFSDAMPPEPAKELLRSSGFPLAGKGNPCRNRCFSNRYASCFGDLGAGNLYLGE